MVVKRYGEGLTEHLLREATLRIMFPAITLGPGYFILDTRPGAINVWRPLGDKSRPLAQLVAFEESLWKKN